MSYLVILNSWFCLFLENENIHDDEYILYSYLVRIWKRIYLCIHIWSGFENLIYSVQNKIFVTHWQEKSGSPESWQGYQIFRCFDLKTKKCYILGTKDPKQDKQKIRKRTNKRSEKEKKKDLKKDQKKIWKGPTKDLKKLTNWKEIFICTFWFLCFSIHICNCHPQFIRCVSKHLETK